MRRLLRFFVYSALTLTLVASLGFGYLLATDEVLRFILMKNIKGEEVLCLDLPNAGWLNIEGCETGRFL